MSRAKADLVDWWFHHLNESQRNQLMDGAGLPLSPDLALELWRGSGTLRVVQPAEWSVEADPLTWSLTADTAAFVQERARERSRSTDR